MNRLQVQESFHNIIHVARVYLPHIFLFLSYLPDRIIPACPLPPLIPLSSSVLGSESERVGRGFTTSSQGSAVQPLREDPLECGPFHHPPDCRQPGDVRREHHTNERPREEHLRPQKRPLDLQHGSPSELACGTKTSPALRMAPGEREVICGRRASRCSRGPSGRTRPFPRRIT